MSEQVFSHKWQTQGDNCIAVLREVEDALMAGKPADRTLSAIFRRERKYGSRDRRFFESAIFSRYRWLGVIRNTVLNDTDLKLQVLVSYLADGAELPPAAELWLDSLESDVKERFKVAMTLNSPMERLSAFLQADITPEMLLTGDILAHLRANMEEKQLQSYLVSLQSRSPVWCRVAKAHIDEVVSEWRRAGYAFTQHPQHKNAFLFANDRLHFEQLKTKQRGYFEIQDFSSQCIGLAANPQPGEHWFDACSGGGGKTLQLADMMHGAGRISVYDIRPQKLDDLQFRANRTEYAHMIQRESVAVPNKTFDGILIDAPCSSSGRWRRNPEIKWMPPVIPFDELLSIQTELLEKLCTRVKIGGKLVYGTCSVCTEENQRQMERFLEKHGNDFELMPFTSPHTGEKISSAMLQTLPEDANCDGSFVAVLQRKN